MRVILAHKYFPAEGAYAGCDFTGEVVKLGPNLRVGVEIGDRVSATVTGSKSPSYRRIHRKRQILLTCRNIFLDTVSGRGGFAEYAKVPSDLVWKIPQGSLSFEQAAATGSPYVPHPRRL